MSIVAGPTRRTFDGIRAHIGEEPIVPRELTIDEIKRALGLDKIKPISATPSDQIDMLEKGDCFKDWYEEELRRIYNTEK